MLIEKISTCKHLYWRQ